mmetsp:Transcript_12755/g.32300  ORF Transcript_12755/g.32300 Transcript_12755/m.32300 type:complete len:83 (+) Transcript_12755:135-383(+)
MVNFWFFKRSSSSGSECSGSPTNGIPKPPPHSERKDIVRVSRALENSFEALPMRPSPQQPTVQQKKLKSATSAPLPPWVQAY